MTTQQDRLRDAAEAFLVASDALDNREINGINAENLDRLQPRKHAARRELEAALAATPAPAAAAARLSDDQLEHLIEDSDGRWKEDVFEIDSRDLMTLLRAVAALAIEREASGSAADGAQDARDAKRWRAFRDRDNFNDLDYTMFEEQYRTDADAVIDAAISAEHGESYQTKS